MLEFTETWCRETVKGCCPWSWKLSKSKNSYCNPLGYLLACTHNNDEAKTTFWLLLCHESLSVDGVVKAPISDRGSSSTTPNREFLRKTQKLWFFAPGPNTYLIAQLVLYVFWYFSCLHAQPICKKINLLRCHCRKGQKCSVAPAMKSDPSSVNQDVDNIFSKEVQPLLTLFGQSQGLETQDIRSLLTSHWLRGGPGFGWP